MTFTIIDCPTGIIYIIIAPLTIIGIRERKLKLEVSCISGYIREYKAGKELHRRQQDLFSVMYIEVRDLSIQSQKVDNTNSRSKDFVDSIIIPLNILERVILEDFLNKALIGLVDASLDQKKIKIFGRVNKNAIKIPKIYPVPEADIIATKNSRGSLKKELQPRYLHYSFILREILLVIQVKTRAMFPLNGDSKDILSF